MGIIEHDIKKGGWISSPEQGPMSEESKSAAEQEQGAGEKSRDIRLAEALRANLLKRKAQARARSSSKPCDEGGQSKP
jgi:hypothetical protein